MGELQAEPKQESSAGAGLAAAQEIIAAEYNYIAQSAFQANEDRRQASQFFLISFGSFLAAVFSTQVDPNAQRILFGVVAGICAFVWIYGAITLLQLARLRQAWLDSARAMNAIKDAYIREIPALGELFVWNTDTLPPAWKPHSVSFYQALSVAVVSGIALGAGLTFLCFAFGYVLNLLGIICVFVAGVLSAYAWMLLFYRRLLRA